ncbi:FxSxx-COOH cyclophane-containing RiPP peptide [Embleya sp. NPDC055664]|uniref:FxSxx-COOH cyclophane-containing RiPP peptide n=1 Tax=Embleya sp. NPDC059237 TaxID=3346784 RepID=UPI0036AAA0F9
MQRERGDVESALPDLDGLCLDDLDHLPASVLASALRRLVHESEEPSEAVVAGFTSVVDPVLVEAEFDPRGGNDRTGGPRADGSGTVRA